MLNTWIWEISLHLLILVRLHGHMHVHGFSAHVPWPENYWYQTFWIQSLREAWEEDWRLVSGVISIVTIGKGSVTSDSRADCLDAIQRARGTGDPGSRHPTIQDWDLRGYLSLKLTCEALIHILDPPNQTQSKNSDVRMNTNPMNQTKINQYIIIQCFGLNTKAIIRDNTRQQK